MIDDGSGVPRSGHHQGEGFGVLVLINEAPAIVDFTSEEAFPVVCESVPMQALVDEDDDSPFTVLWEVFGPREFGGVLGPLDHSSSASYVVPPGPARSEVTWACPEVGTFDVRLTATDEQGSSTTFAMWLHCHEALVGTCGNDGVAVGAASCDPIDWIQLDAACVAERLGPVPTCEMLCPGGTP